MNELSISTQAILLITSDFSKNSIDNTKPLNPQEWGEFAKWLNEHNLKPEDLLTGDIQNLLQEWNNNAISIKRLMTLLNRGGALALAMEKWQRVGIWVITRGSNFYPKQLKKKLKNLSPPLFYGIGNQKLLNKQSIGVLGENRTSKDCNFSYKQGGIIANDGYTLVTSGDNDINASVIKGTLEKEGTAIVFLSNNLLQATLDSRYRNAILNQDIVLLSSCSPDSSFNEISQNNQNIYIESLAMKIFNFEIKENTLFDTHKNIEKVSIIKKEKTISFFDFFISQLKQHYSLNKNFKPKELEEKFNLKSSQINSWLIEAEDKNIIKKLEGIVRKYQLI
jgi:predicted Rossmann fold nucleotide-binding protein DprA/Smf involved in DNA uptake